MKEVKLLTEWADKITEAPVATRSNRLGTPMSAKADRPLPRNLDIQYKAQRAHPDLSPEQALSLYMSNELVDKEKMDFAQNKLINKVKGENEKLTRTVNELGKELHDFEQQSQQTDQEVERLKTLSAKLKPAGELTQQVAQATTQQIEKMMKDVDDLRMKPGMTPDKQKELEQKINDIKSGGLSSKEVQNINNTIEVLSAKQDIDDQMFDNVMSKLEKTQIELAKKEKRFEKSVTRNAEKIGKWGNSFKELDSKVSEIEKRADEKLAQIEQASEEADETLNRIAQMVRQMNPQSVQPLAQTLSTIDDRDEVQQAMATPSSTTLPSLGTEFDDDEVVTIDEPEDNEEDYASVQDLLNKYRKPKNVKNNGQLGEQIEMVEPSEDEMETVIVPFIMRRYKSIYPNDMKIYSEGQLKTMILRTVDRGLLIWQPNVDEERINKYIQALHNWMRKLRPVNPELPGMPEAPPRTQTSIQESMFSEFERDLTKLTNGY